MNEEQMKDLQIRIMEMVFTGLHDRSYIQECLNYVVYMEHYSPNDLDRLLSYVDLCFASKASKEKGWPYQTDCDRLDTAFEQLYASGVLTIHHNENEEWEILPFFEFWTHFEAQIGRQARGYCCYYAQGVRAALRGYGLRIIGGVRPNQMNRSQEVYNSIHDAFVSNGLRPLKWEFINRIQCSIEMPNFKWQRRLASIAAPCEVNEVKASVDINPRGAFASYHSIQPTITNGVNENVLKF